MDADADVAGFEVAVAEDSHRVEFLLLGVGDLGFARVGAGVDGRADAFSAALGLDFPGLVHERIFVADREHADLLGGEPDGEVAGVVLDEETDETLVRAELRAVGAAGDDRPPRWPRSGHLPL